MKYGIDVCSYQGLIDWGKVKKAGCQFAVLKCIRKDLNQDTAFARNVAGCRSNDIPISVYTYVYERDVTGAKKRAQAAVRSCQKQGVKGCVIWWDVEDKSIRKTGAASRYVLTKSIKAAREVITSAGYGFGVYCDADFYGSCLNAKEIGGKWWVAAYHGNPVTTFGTAPKYKKPVIATELCGWQYCSKGRISGIGGSVDLDLAYDGDFTEKATVETAETTSATGNPYPAPTITIASRVTAEALKLQRWVQQGEMVKAVQWELIRLGYSIGALDGIMGPKTDAAVEEFQGAAGLTVDKAVGRMTWAALVAAKEKPRNTNTVETPINWRERVAKAAKEVYPLCVGKVHGGTDVGKVVDLASLKKHKALSCNRMVSITLQEAGLLPKGVVLAHTEKAAGKKTVKDAVKNVVKLSHCEVHWFNKKFKDLPEKWKQAGCIYIQNSNACISAGGGKIWSCNRSKGYKYRGRGDYLRTDGYPFDSGILVVIVPKG